MSALTDRLVTAGFRLGWSGVKALPEPAAYGLFNRVADVAVRRGGKGIDRLRANYRRVRPELDDAQLNALVRAGMRSYMRYYCEAFRLPVLGREAIDRGVVAEGMDEAQKYAARGETTIGFVGHLGNFDLAAAWSAYNFQPVATVAERLKPEEVYEEFLAFRTSINMDIIPLTGGPPPFPQLRDRVRAGGTFIALASDRDLTHNGVEVDLLGHRARMAKGPAVLALTTGAPLFAAAIHYERAASGQGLGGHRTHIRFSGRILPRVDGPTAVQAQDMIQQCADHLAPTIREHTSSWHMLQKVFVEDLDPARSSTPAAAPEDVPGSGAAGGTRT